MFNGVPLNIKNKQIFLELRNYFPFASDTEDDSRGGNVAYWAMKRYSSKSYPKKIVSL